jgi:hypothetical protein
MWKRCYDKLRQRQGQAEKSGRKTEQAVRLLIDALFH